MKSHSAIGSVENTIRAVTRLSKYLSNIFYREFKDIHKDKHKTDLEICVDWQDENLKEIHDPIASINSNQ